MSEYIWQYYLIVPTASVNVAENLGPSMDNPGKLKDTFFRFPMSNFAGQHVLPASHWVGSFLAKDKGSLSRQVLENHFRNTPGVNSLFWVRCKNPDLPDASIEEKNRVVATNWNKVSVGDVVTLDTVISKLGSIL